MDKYRSIEFASTDEGTVLVIRHNEGPSYLKDPQNVELVEELYERIEKEFPQAFEALSKYYAKSKPNLPFFRYKLVRKFVRCNFGSLDFTTDDIDENNHLNFERVSCPCRGECPMENIVCSPIFATGLTRREEEILKIACKGGTAEQIADKMCLSVQTIRSHMNHTISTLHFHSYKEVINWWHENNQSNSRKG